MHAVIRTRAAAVLALLTLVVPASYAGRERFTIDNPTYRSECGSCHVAYPPQLLPAESWRQVMRGLDKHFGSDASVDPAMAREIERWLVANAGRARAGTAPVLRISETRWFLREHDEVPAARWKSAAVRSPSNCGACHIGAEHGDFSERNLRRPNQEK